MAGKVNIKIEEIPQNTEREQVGVGPHFEIEELPGTFEEGVTIDPKLLREKSVLEVSDGSKRKFRLHTKNGFSIPNRFYDKTGLGLKPPTTISTSARNACENTVSLFSHDTHFPDGTELLSTRLGDFDKNGLLDLVYTVQKDGGEIASLVYYQQNLFDNCLKEQVQQLNPNNPLKNFQEKRKEKSLLVQSNGAFRAAMQSYLRNRKSMNPKAQELLRKLSVHRYKVAQPPENDAQAIKVKRNGTNQKQSNAKLSTLVAIQITDWYSNTELDETEVVNRMEAYDNFLMNIASSPRLIAETYRFIQDSNPHLYYQTVTNAFETNWSHTQQQLAVRLASRIMQSLIEENEEVTEQQAKTLAKNIRAIIDKLEADEAITINYLLEQKINNDDWDDLDDSFTFLASSSSVEGLPWYEKLYQLIDSIDELNPEQLKKYASILQHDYPPKLRDLLAAEEAVGAENAVLLTEKHNITRFGRYHESILKHNVDLIKSPRGIKNKRIVLSAVAKKDDEDRFYWGEQFEHDENVKVINIEVGDVKKFYSMLSYILITYGTPDVILLSAHGAKDRIILGDEKFRLRKVSIKRDDLEDFGNFIRSNFSRPPQFVVNACDIATPDENGESYAQVMANETSGPTRAAKGIEIIMDLKLYFEGERARVYPHFFQLGGLSTFGYQVGGYEFLPQRKNTVVAQQTKQKSRP